MADRGGSPRRAKLTASDGTAGDEFGFSSAVFRSTAVVGARGKNSAMGAAYVFVYTSVGWVQQAELIAHDGALQDYFGWAVAISGSTAVIGAPYRNFGTGAVYVFVRSGDTWSEQAELRAPDGSEYDHFGWSVAVFRTSLVVGAFGKNTNTGAAYVFVRSGDTWSQQAELTASDGATVDVFGTRLVPLMNARSSVTIGLIMFGTACIGMAVAWTFPPVNFQMSQESMVPKARRPA